MYDYFYSINGIFLIRLTLKTFDGNYGMLNKRNIVLQDVRFGLFTNARD